jgi:hypothetical protein
MTSMSPGAYVELDGRDYDGLVVSLNGLGVLLSRHGYLVRRSRAFDPAALVVVPVLARLVPHVTRVTFYSGAVQRFTK